MGRLGGALEQLRHPVGAVVATAAVLAFSWWAAGLRPFTWPALAAVGAAWTVAVAAGTAARRPSGAGRGDGGGALVWAVLVVALAGCELAAYVQHPRVDHPTLSSLAGPLLDWRPARALAFAVWALVGADLARR